jgi:hypothetical protein
MEAVYFPMPGFIRFYNRLPHPLEFQYDSRPYSVPAHIWTAATFEVAQAAWKASRYKIKLDGSSLHGVVFENDPAWGTPLLPEELHEGDPILSSEVDIDLAAKDFGGRRYGPPEVVSIVQSRETLPQRRAAIDPRSVSVLVTGAEG